jgi:hypothetical protein
LFVKKNNIHVIVFDFKQIRIPAGAVIDGQKRGRAECYKESVHPRAKTGQGRSRDMWIWVLQ